MFSVDFQSIGAGSRCGICLGIRLSTRGLVVGDLGWSRSINVAVTFGPVIRLSQLKEHSITHEILHQLAELQKYNAIPRQVRGPKLKLRSYFFSEKFR